MKTRLILLGLLFLSLAVLLISPMIGKERFLPLTLLIGQTSSIDTVILRDIRIPRALTAFLVGSSLALSGLTFQAMFRNPLATPFTLGTASGASLGAALYIRLGISFSLLGLPGITLASFSGSLLSLFFVYGLTRLRSGFPTATLLLAGVAVNFFCSSLILFIQYISGYADSFRIIRWMMGSINATGYSTLIHMLPFVGLGTLILAGSTHELNLLLTGEDMAASRGMNVNAVKTRLFFAASLMIGGVVAFCGPIGFIGMIAPHICRVLLGSEHRSLLPATFLFGGFFLLLCDTLARTLIYPVEIPVGIITSLIGGPFFLLLLLNRKGALTC